MPRMKKFDLFENTEDLESMFLTNSEDLGSMFLTNIEVDLGSMFLR